MTVSVTICDASRTLVTMPWPPFMAGGGATVAVIPTVGATEHKGDGSCYYEAGFGVSGNKEASGPCVTTFFMI